ncbi:MAG: tetratricopeptide repeat protein [Syntrophomonadaceae bacterium]|nr:tetratricopeptide repeat protein [Syntrophomonadaceae bacterium]
MPVKPSEPCPCGSGKKNRFCCFPLSSLFEQTAELINENYLNAALEKLEEAIREYPNNLEILAYQYLILEMMGHSKQAEALLKQVVNKNPRYSWGLHLQGLRLIQKNKLVEAIECFQQALLFYPVTAPERVVASLSALGDCYYDLSDYQTARKTWQKALELDPSNSNLIDNLLFLIYENTSLPEEERIKDLFYQQFFTQGKAAIRARIATLHYEAFAAFDNQELERAFALSQEILGLDTEYKTAWFLLGSIAIKQHDLDHAIHYLRHYTALEEDRELAKRISLLLDDLDHPNTIEESEYLEWDLLDASLMKELEPEKEGEEEEEPYLIYELTFQIRQQQPLLTELRQKPFLVEEEDWGEEIDYRSENETRFTWWEEPNAEVDSPLLLGSLIISGGQMTLICLSAQLIDEGQDMLESEVGVWLEDEPQLRGRLIRGDQYLEINASDLENLDIEELEDFIRLSRT